MSFHVLASAYSDACRFAERVLTQLNSALGALSGMLLVPPKALLLPPHIHRLCMQRNPCESLTGSVAAAAQDEKRLYVRSQEARAAAAELEEAPGGVEIFNENENALYCVCQQPYNVDTSMIECDSCHEWYHVKCVGLSQVCISISTS